MPFNLASPKHHLVEFVTLNIKSLLTITISVQQKAVTIKRWKGSEIFKDDIAQRTKPELCVWMFSLVCGPLRTTDRRWDSKSKLRKESTTILVSTRGGPHKLWLISMIAHALLLIDKPLSVNPTFTIMANSKLWVRSNSVRLSGLHRILFSQLKWDCKS